MAMKVRTGSGTLVRIQLLLWVIIVISYNRGYLAAEQDNFEQESKSFAKEVELRDSLNYLRDLKVK